MMRRSQPDDPGRPEGPWWLDRLEEHIPEGLRRLEIRILLCLTAGAFGRRAPSLRGLNADQCLEAYKRYTVQEMNGRSREEADGLRRDLYRRAYRAGRLLSHLPGLKGNERKRRLVLILYRGIDITIEGDLPGNFIVPRCSFSSVYTPKICYVMSGLDAGIICGIFGGGRLTFTARLTEGAEACKAILQKNQP